MLMTSFKRTPSRRQGQSGYFLLEIIIGLGVAGLVLAYTFGVLATGQDQADGRTDADSLASFSQLSSQYFLSNRTAIELAMTDGTAAATYCKINVAADGTGGTTTSSTTKHTCAFDTTQLRAKGLWPASLSPDTANGNRPVAIFRQIYDTATPPVATGGVDVLIVQASKTGTLTAAHTDPHTTQTLLAAQSTLGGVGGMVPVGDLGPCSAKRSTATYQVCGNGWKVNLTDFVDSSALTTFSTALPN